VAQALLPMHPFAKSASPLTFVPFLRP